MARKIKILFILACTAVAAVAGGIILTIIARNPYLGAFDREKLGSLKYAAWTSTTKNIEEKGVTLYDSELACAGYNLYNYDGFPGAYLVDMDGTLVRSWTLDAEDLQYVEMCPDGGIIGVDNLRKLIRVEPDASNGWEVRGAFHHDISIPGNGNIYALENKTERLRELGIKDPIFVPYVIVLDQKGVVKREISLADAMLNSGLRPNLAKAGVLSKQWRAMRKPRGIWVSVARHIKKHGLGPKFFARLGRRIITPGLALFGMRGGVPPGVDIFHANTLEVIERDVYFRGRELFKKGDLLVCFRNLDLIAVVDSEKELIKWTWGPGEIMRPHHPSLLANGNILIFDNGRSTRKYSRVIEMEPATGKVVWEYGSDPPEEFYSRIRGSAQRLPNGNTLIMESSDARAFEVTKDGRVVWEFYGTVVEPEKKRRRPIYRITRSFGIGK